MEPISQQYFMENRADFESAGWEYHVGEEIFSTDASPVEMLGLTAPVSIASVKKAYKVLSKFYMKFTNPNHPDVVQARANAIMCKVNAAKTVILDQNWRRHRDH